MSRISFQYWQAPEARLWLSAVAVVCWGWLFFSLLITRRQLVALGLGLGLAFDLGIRVALRTVDAPWMPGITANLVTWALIGALLAALFRLDLASEVRGSTFGPSIALLAIGPTFALYHLMLGNLGLAQSHLGLDYPGAAIVLTFGMAVGILGAALRSSGEVAILSNKRWWLAWRLSLATAVAIGFVWFWSIPTLGSIGLCLSVGASVVLITELLLESDQFTTTTVSNWTAIFFTIGLLIEVGLLFGYYTYSGSPVVLSAVVAIFLAVTIAGTPKTVPRIRRGGFPVVILAGAMGCLLLLASSWEIWSWNDASATSAIGPTITVMTYNIQSGFSANDRFDLEQTAQVIEAQHPDIVVLQEVSRGWLVTSGIDEVLWLSQRLNMNYAFGANSDDGLWGNVVLTRAPIGSVQKVQYDVTQNLKRSVLEVQIETQAGEITVLATHLDDPANAGPVRLRQASELIAAWNHESPALLLGDMNSDPTDPVITLFQSAGFVDYDRALASSDYTSKDGRRIDYILGTPDIALMSIEVPDVWTSDHRPVVAVVTILPVQASVPDSIKALSTH